MFLLRAVRASVLAAIVASPAMAQGGGDLLPRQPLKKRAITELPAGDVTSLRLIVKFNDDVMARSREGGRSVIAQSNRDMAPLRQVMNQFGVRIVPAINHAEERLAELQVSASLHSGKSQPDLAGLMYITGAQDGEGLLAVAQALNALEFVEYVSFELPRVLSSADPMHLSAIQTNELDAQLADDELVQRTNATLQLRKSIVTSIDVPALLGGGLDLQVPLMAGLPVTLRLDPHSVRAADFQMLEALPNGGMAPIDPGPERTLRGDIAEIRGATVAGALVDDGLLVGIRLADGAMWFIEPIAGVVEGAAPGDHVIYAQADALDNQGFCGTGPEHQVQLAPGFDQAPANGAAAAAGGGPIFAEIALDLDFAYYQAFGEDASAAGLRAAAVISVLNIQYEMEVGIKHVITTIVVRTSQGSDPYTTDDPFELLDQFTDEWNDNNDAIRRDVAHLFTGRNTGNIIGVAWIGGICQDFSGLGYSFAQLYSTFGCQTDLSAHELGHNWSAFHCDCPDNTMNPVINCSNTFETLFTVPDIVAWRDFLVGQGCIGDVGPAGCGAAGTTDCGAASGTPYCKDVICCGTVCAVDPACCEDAWDEMCVAAADDLCTGCGASNAGECLEANLTPGCSDQTCCDAVCAIDPICCAGIWDENCAFQAFFNCVIDDLGDTPDLTIFQAYRTFSATPGFSAITEAVLGPGAEYNGEGYDLNGLWALGEDLTGALGGGVENLTRGKTIKVAVLETACYADHEDLDVTVEPGQTMYLNEQITSPSHGTAVLGIIAAVDNGFGMTGIASDADAYFFPSFSLEQGGRFLSALTSAALTLGPGDVLNMSLGPDNTAGGDCNNGVLTSDPTTWILVRLMSDLGISTYISAGNECCNLDATPEDGGDSGATIVSAVDPGFPFCRRAFSNHNGGEGDIPHISAWGEVVATLGAGNLFGAANDPNRQYRVDFNGTSAASPMAAGLAACMQGLAKTLYGIPLMPEQIRGTMQNGYCQCLICDPDLQPGSIEGLECGGDIEPPEDEDPNLVGVMTDAMAAASAVLTGGFFDGSPLIDDIEVLRGTLVFGNEFSIKESDNNRLQIKSQYTEPTDNQHLGITYLGFGHMTDVKIVAHADIPGVATIAVIVEGHSSDGLPAFGDVLVGNALILVEMFDWPNNRWQVQAIDNMLIRDPPELGLPIPVYPVVNAWRFVNDDGRIETRLWTLTLGGLFAGGFGGAPEGTYLISYDWIDIRVGVDGDIFLPP